MMRIVTRYPLPVTRFARVAETSYDYEAALAELRDLLRVTGTAKEIKMNITNFTTINPIYASPLRVTDNA